MVRIGFIGSGNMASALISAFIDAEACKPNECIASDVIPELLEKIKREKGINIAQDNAEVIRNSDIVFLAVKPQIMNKVLGEIKEEIGQQIIISIAAGITISKIEEVVGNDKKIIRVMPNTPCLVGEMAAGFSSNKNILKQESEDIQKLLNCAGEAVLLEEEKLDIVTGLSGSGPAFVAFLIKSFADEGMAQGLSEKDAYTLSLKTFQGTAKLLREKNLTPEKLIEMVSSPNGTTVAGREILENSDVNEKIRQTISSAAKRSRELGR